MQFSLLHVLTAFATRFHSRLFFDFAEQVKAADGKVFKALDCNFVSQQGTLIDLDDSKITTVSLSRPTLEALDRRLTLERCPNVKIIYGKAVDFTISQSKIDSVHVRLNGEKDSTDYDCSLFVECSGLGRFGLKHFRQKGVEIGVDSYDMRGIYSDLRFKLTEEQWRSLPMKRTPDETAWLQLCLCAPNEDKGHMTCGRLEGNEVAFVIGAINESPGPVRNAQEALELIQRGDSQPWFKNDFVPALVKLQPDAHATVVKLPPSSRVHFDRARGLPCNFVAVGDSVYRLNPVYGQGITQTSVMISTLDGLLRRERKKLRLAVDIRFSKRYFALAQRRVDGMAEINKQIDYLWHGTIPGNGDTLSASPNLFIRFFATIERACHHDPHVSEVFMGVLGGVESVLAFASPMFLARVAYDALWRRR